MSPDPVELDEVDDTDAPADDEREEIISGPFCPHWADPSDCDEPCTCGHVCREHGGGTCRVDGCPCNGPVDV